MTQDPHDALCKAAFSQRENAVGAIKAALPPAALAQLDLDTLRPTTTSYVDERLGKSFSDLVYEVEIAGQPGFVCFLLYEHQSTVDPLAALWVVFYMVRIWDGWLADHPGATKVPPVIPIVLYHGARPWDAPLTLGAILDLPDAARAALGDLLPELRYELDDLTLASDEAIRAREMADFGRLALLLLKHGRALRARPGPDSLGAFVRSVQDLLTVLPRNDRERTWVYILNVAAEPEADVVIEALREALPPEQHEEVMTAGDALRLEGKRQGMLEGKQQGKLEGKREALLALFRRKFRQLSADAERRVAEADERSLDRWTEAVLFASTLDEVWSRP